MRAIRGLHAAPRRSNTDRRPEPSQRARSSRHLPARDPDPAAKPGRVTTHRHPGGRGSRRFRPAGQSPRLRRSSTVVRPEHQDRRLRAVRQVHGLPAGGSGRARTPRRNPGHSAVGYAVSRAHDRSSAAGSTVRVGYRHETPQADHRLGAELRPPARRCTAPIVGSRVGGLQAASTLEPFDARADARGAGAAGSRRERGSASATWPAPRQGRGRPTSCSSDGDGAMTRAVPKGFGRQQVKTGSG